MFLTSIEKCCFMDFPLEEAIIVTSFIQLSILTFVGSATFFICLVYILKLAGSISFLICLEDIPRLVSSSSFLVHSVSILTLIGLGSTGGLEAIWMG